MIDILSNDEKQGFWQQHMVGWEESGLSQEIYCEAQGISYSTFGYWRKKFNRAPDSIKFIKAATDCHLKKPATPILQILLPNGIRIGVSETANIGSIREILLSLGAL